MPIHIQHEEMFKEDEDEKQCISGTYLKKCREVKNLQILNWYLAAIMNVYRLSEGSLSIIIMRVVQEVCI